MKALGSILGVCLTAGVACWLVVTADFEEAARASGAEAPKALERAEAEPQPIAPAPISIAAPPAAAEVVVEPAQTIEDRGDAMLSEIDALGGTPFDQAITMPFD